MKFERIDRSHPTLPYQIQNKIINTYRSKRYCDYSNKSITSKAELEVAWDMSTGKIQSAEQTPIIHSSARGEKKLPWTQIVQSLHVNI